MLTVIKDDDTSPHRRSPQRCLCHCCLCIDLSTADLFDILLPMLNIYQEFVRNHQYSLQILAHCKQNRDFDKLLKQYEAKPDCEERTLETFLTYPMFQVRSQGYNVKYYFNFADVLTWLCSMWFACR